MLACTGLYLVKKDQRGGLFTVSPLSEVENSEDGAVEGSTGVTRGEAQSGVLDQLLLQAAALELGDVLGSCLAAAHREREGDVWPADCQEVRPEASYRQLPDTGQQLKYSPGVSSGKDKAGKPNFRTVCFLAEAGAYELVKW